MLIKKLIVSAMGTGLLWAAGLAGHAALASHPGLLLLVGQVRLSLGDREGGLSLMQRAAQPDQDVQPEQAVARPAAVPVSSTADKCRPNARVRRVSSSVPKSARLVLAGGQVPPRDFAAQIARHQRELVRLSLEQGRWSEQVRVLVEQRMRDLPQPPAVPVEPLRANP